MVSWGRPQTILVFRCFLMSPGMTDILWWLASWEVSSPEKTASASVSKQPLLEWNVCWKCPVVNQTWASNIYLYLSRATHQVLNILDVFFPLEKTSQHSSSFPITYPSILARYVAAQNYDAISQSNKMEGAGVPMRRELPTGLGLFRAVSPTSPPHSEMNPPLIHTPRALWAWDLGPVWGHGSRCYHWLAGCLWTNYPNTFTPQCPDLWNGDDWRYSKCLWARN